MTLTYRIGLRLFIAISILLSIWGVFFYVTIVEEINDEADDTLEEYAESVMLNFLSGDTTSTTLHLGNNFYRLREVSEHYANQHPILTYKDSMIFIPAKYEREPARIRTLIFQNENNRFYELMVAIPNIEKTDLISSILFWIFLLYATLLVVILIINVWIYHRSTRPLYRLLGWLNNYKPGKQREEFHNPTEIVEFKRLNEAVLQSVERTERVVEEQKQFTGNASHEIQTPVAIAMNRLEMLMEDETLSKKQMEEIVKTHQTLSTLARLNKTLLLLYKIDNSQFQEKTTVLIDELVANTLSDLRDIYSHLEIDVRLTKEASLQWQMNEGLAEILVNNLLKNAFLHNYKQGKIIIHITNSKLRISNTATCGALQADALFKRFHQTKNKKGGTGLGLALVKAVCDTEKLFIQYLYKNDLHTFEISK